MHKKGNTVPLNILDESCSSYEMLVVCNKRFHSTAEQKSYFQRNKKKNKSSLCKVPTHVGVRKKWIKQQNKQ